MWLERLWQDLRHGIRVFAKSPGFTAIAVLSIACGTGANVAMFSTADALLLRPISIPRANDLISVGSSLQQGPLTTIAASYPDFVDVQQRSKAFRALVAYSHTRAGVALTGAGARQVRIVTSVSGNFFDALGIEMHLGRGFLTEEDRVPGRDAVAVVSYGMWQQLFAADPHVVGRDLVIAGTAFTVVGVAAEAFTGVEAGMAPESAYVPLAMWSRVASLAGGDPLTTRDLRVLTVKGWLSRGTTLQEARAELAVVGRDLERLYPDTNAGRALTAYTELQARMMSGVQVAALVLILVVLSAAVLCVACANVAGLLTSRAPLRAREVAVRLALGAGRGRLVTQLLTESLAIGLAGSLGGLAVGYAGIVLVRRIQLPTDMFSLPTIQMDLRALAFSLAIACVSVLLFGLGPALRTTRIDLSSSLRSTGAAGVRRWRIGGRSHLVALQVALSLVLLTVATFAFQAFGRAFANGPGFRTSQMAMLSVDTGQARYSVSRAVQFFQRTLDEIRRLPGVRSASLTADMPLWGFELAPIVPEGYRFARGQDSATPFANVVDDQYFETMEIPIVRGRAFAPTDTATAPLVAVVNETLAQRYWPAQDPLGRRFRMKDASGPWVEIVGVAKNSTYLYPAEPAQDMVYFPFTQQPRGSMTLLVHTAGASAAPLPAVQELMRRLDPAVPVYDAQTIESFYAALATTIGDVVTSMIGGIGVMGMAITAIGLYGLVSYAVSRRTREIGIRMAVGATYGRVLRMLLRQGLGPAWVGTGAGIALSLATARVLPMLAPFAPSYDVRSLFAVVPVLLAVTLFAAFVPARRAARIEPTIALRHE